MSDLPSILPPNAGTVERDLEQVMTRLQGLSIPLTTLWNLETCPEPLLPYLAWAMSIEVWDDTWSVEQKRASVKNSVAVHRVKGTRGAVERALTALGFHIDLTEWFETGDPVHTFRLDAYGRDVFDAGFAVDAALALTVSRVIENVKPVRSHYTLRIGETFEHNAHLRNRVLSSYRHRLDLNPAACAHEADTAILAQSAHRIRRVECQDLVPSTRTAIASGALAVRSGSRAQAVSRVTHDFQVTEGAAYVV